MRKTIFHLENEKLSFLRRPIYFLFECYSKQINRYYMRSRRANILSEKLRYKERSDKKNNLL